MTVQFAPPGARAMTRLDMARLDMARLDAPAACSGRPRTGTVDPLALLRSGEILEAVEAAAGELE
ncbi:hypothetical protein [Methylobacterium sp. A54F]